MTARPEPTPPIRFTKFPRSLYYPKSFINFTNWRKNETKRKNTWQKRHAQIHQPLLFAHVWCESPNNTNLNDTERPSVSHNRRHKRGKRGCRIRGGQLEYITFLIFDHLLNSVYQMESTHFLTLS